MQSRRRKVAGRKRQKSGFSASLELIGAASMHIWQFMVLSEIKNRSRFARDTSAEAAGVHVAANGKLHHAALLP
jgi:hypothetical protein